MSPVVPVDSQGADLNRRIDGAKIISRGETTRRTTAAALEWVTIYGAAIKERDRRQAATRYRSAARLASQVAELLDPSHGGAPE